MSSTLKNIEFYGKHAEIIEKISVTNDNVLGFNYPPIFNRIIDSMYIAGLIGLIYKRSSSIDKSTSSKRTIFSDTVFSNILDINFYTAIPIIKTKDLDVTSNVKLAFFTDEESENYLQKRFDIFYGYVLGGLEIIDEKVLNNLSETDEMDVYYKLEELISEIIEMLNVLPTEDFKIEFDMDNKSLI